MTSLTWDRHRGHISSYDVITPGFNYRLDEMRAALGLVQLARLEANNARRRELTRLYRERLGELLQLPFLEELQNSSCHIFPALLPKPMERSRFMDFLKNRGIQSSIHYPPIHRFSYYQQLWPSGFDHQLPQTEEVAAREITLPLFPGMTMPQMEEVIGAVQDFCRS